MTTNNKYSRNQIDKLGNGLIYLIEKMGFLPKTSLLKLVYILDEYSVKKRGFPMFNLQYEIWKYGPVCQDLYIEFNDGASLLKEYIKSEVIENATHISPVADFNDDEFSDSDIAIFDEEMPFYKDLKSVAANLHCPTLFLINSYSSYVTGGN